MRERSEAMEIDSGPDWVMGGITIIVIVIIAVVFLRVAGVL